MATKKEDLPAELQEVIGRLVGEGARQKYQPILTALQQVGDGLPEGDPVRQILADAASSVTVVIAQGSK